MKIFYRIQKPLHRERCRGLYLDSCLVLTDEKAVGEKVYVILEVLVKHLQDEYKKLMQVLWA